MGLEKRVSTPPSPRTKNIFRIFKAVFSILLTPWPPPGEHRGTPRGGGITSGSGRLPAVPHVSKQSATFSCLALHFPNLKALHQGAEGSLALAGCASPGHVSLYARQALSGTHRASPECQAVQGMAGGYSCNPPGLSESAFSVLMVILHTGFRLLRAELL